MPIYEFKCQKCEAFFEILVMSKDESVEMKCPECDSEDFERVISTTSHTINAAPGSQQGATSQTRHCSSGSCTTYTIPGPNG
jgi:putative FmdB family regulatory protein